MTVDMSQANEKMDYQQHEQTYLFFTNLVKYGTILVALIVIGMALFLV